MWNNRGQEELLAKLEQLHSHISDIQRKGDEQQSNQERLQSKWTERLASLQAQVDGIEKLEKHAAQQQLQIEALTAVIHGLQRGITGDADWSHLPPDDVFWQTTSEEQEPFVVSFSPRMELMLWIGHARFPTLPTTSLILPRSYARRSFVRIPKSEDGEPQHVTLSETDVDKMPDGYIALLLDGYAAPPTWIDILLAFKAEQDLNMWLVWFLDDKADSQHAGVRVAVACPKQDFDREPVVPPEWREKRVIYFERHPSHRMTFPIPRTPITSSDLSDSEPNGAPASESSAN